ncbi:Asp-tRNA(Asn)/Glu-tRNA(Gln) amidotransferase subunit GatC [candidate division NPL-UPA2 bacterium Unc8]|uniref:Aspartyl/glutamyl-tRNA(Asn/Gln) amidotransferase subunit C n=1 Tax=candidate division NPL-UPA2 bacterium Unc8 TaxID=1980939 RepID=A0A399FXI4_UNCN2|nr:Aspartyl/glutamyl-tRNA(Asn/Gln) amidotransferase subunit C [Bacillota bacterium]MBT9146493.1 Aspartyl/glutamyl-tRNA(Asn/Gln) amidotransferase subunit C [Bacillota bacterium]RII01128.1 MAG: Asp-tRNA(Asn)/Glu-tRNA(Gln) amidotransferase subunit GatC [candidate division NPL-UPA2 bacterium Unc8]
MKIEKKEVEHIARLARLKLNEEEKERFGRQLGQILKYIEKLNELNTEGVEPALHIVPLQNIMRKDEVKDSLPVKDALANAPATKGKYFKVPRIIE